MKKLISVLLAALMLACILPLGAFAIEEESVTFYYTEGTYIQSADGNIILTAKSVGEHGWAVYYDHNLEISGDSTVLTLTHIDAVVSAGGENCGEIYVSDGYAQPDGGTVTVTDIDSGACEIIGDNTDPVEFSQVTVYYHVHNYQPVTTVTSYVCDCGAETNEPPGGEASTLSEGNLTIVCSVACLALGLVGGIVIGRKKPESANE